MLNMDSIACSIIEWEFFGRIFSRVILALTIKDFLAASGPTAGTAAQVVAMLTQTEVDPCDPAFKNPTKLIGPCYSQEEAQR